MRIAYGKVIQPTLHSSVPAYRKIRLIPIDVERATVDTSNADTFVSQFARGQSHRQVPLTGLRPARAGVENCIRTELVREIVAINNVYPFRKTHTKRVSGGPNRLGRQRIVVAWHQKYGDVRTGMIAENLGQTLPEILGRSWVVEKISSAQDCVDAVASSDIKDPRNDLHSCPGQLLLCLVGKGRKPAPEMPIGRVKDLQHDVSGFRAVIRNVT